MNKFILICGDAEDINGKRVPSEEVARFRLDQNKWGIYRHTRNRNSISVNDYCFFYLAGQKSANKQTFIASAQIKGIRDKLRNESIDSEDWLNDVPLKILELSNVKYFEPVSIKPLLKKLSFVNLKLASWGGALQGGCRKLNEEDFNLIKRSI